MSGEKTQEDQAPAIPEGELIEGLQEDPNYFAVKYNEMRQKEIEATQAPKETQMMPTINRLEPDAQPKPSIGFLGAMASSRSGGVYVPPHKLRRMQQEMMKDAQNNEEQLQRIKWEMLRKSINEIINKVNVANIQNVIIELLNENLMRGMGLVSRAIIKAQMASPNFTHVYAALVSVLNTKLPDIAYLIIRRVILQFRRAYQRNNKIVCQATTKFLAHLINQKVLSDLFGLELLIFLLDEPTEDSVDIACDFMKECGQVMSELTPAGVNAIFERFKGILHEGETDRKVQYSIENLFAIRKSKFKDYPGVIPELDLVDDEDQITHNIELDAEITGQEEQNIFRLDPFFEKTEEEWKQIRLSILGEDNILRLKASALQLEDEEDEVAAEPQILDFTEEDLQKLRESIYLIIMNSIDFEECAHKLMKLNIGRGHEEVLSKMIVDCCVQERSYNKFYGLLAQRFCNIDDIYKKFFFRLFVDHYTVIHRFSTNKIRNLAKFFAHLLLTDALDWHVLRCVTLTEEATTSSSRIFLKIMFQDLAENMGLKTLCARMHDPDMKEFFVGIFPTDHPQNARFAANFFGLIGLDPVAQPLKESLITGLMTDEAEKLLQELANQSSSTSSDSDSSSSSSSSDSEDDKERKNPMLEETKKAEKPAQRDPKQSKEVNGIKTTKEQSRSKADQLKKSPVKSRSNSLKKKDDKTKKKYSTSPRSSNKKKYEDKKPVNKITKDKKRSPSNPTKDKKELDKNKEKPRIFKRKRSSSSVSQSESVPKKKEALKVEPPAVKKPIEPKQDKKEPKRSREKEKLRYKVRRDRSISPSPVKKEKEKGPKPKPKLEKKPKSDTDSLSSSSSTSKSSISPKKKQAKPEKTPRQDIKKENSGRDKLDSKPKRNIKKHSSKSSTSSSSSSRSSSSSSPSIKKRKRSRSNEKKTKDTKSKKSEAIGQKTFKEDGDNKGKEKLKVKRRLRSSSSTSKDSEVKPKPRQSTKESIKKPGDSKKEAGSKGKQDKKTSKRDRSSSSRTSSSSSLSTSSNTSSSSSSN